MQLSLSLMSHEINFVADTVTITNHILSRSAWNRALSLFAMNVFYFDQLSLGCIQCFKRRKAY